VTKEERFDDNHPTSSSAGGDFSFSTDESFQGERYIESGWSASRGPANENKRARVGKMVNWASVLVL